MALAMFQLYVEGYDNRRAGHASPCFAPQKPPGGGKRPTVELVEALHP